MGKKKIVSYKSYQVGKAVGDLIMSSPYLTKSQKKKMIRETFESM